MSETDTAQEHRFPCESCGADLRFDPGQTELTCDHCGAVQAIEGAGRTLHPIKELDFLSALQAQLPNAEMEETRVSTCPNCAAEVEFDPDVHSTECPFCATPVVTDTGAHRHIKPRAILPFALQEREARAAMNDWLGSLWFAPSGLSQYARQMRTMQGIYAPFWTFDAQTRSHYSGQRGTVYYTTRTVMRDGKPKQVRTQKVRWRPVSGRVARFFDDVLVLASKSLPRRYADALQPWDLAALEPYDPAFLAGFRAEGYTIDLEEGLKTARTEMDRIIERDVKFDIGGDRQRISHIDTELSDVTFKHILLPIWLAAYRYRGKSYRFVVNGRSGQVRGERPYSTLKIALAVLAGLILAGGAGYLYALYGPK